MNSLLHVGNDTNGIKDSALDAAKAIDQIFTSARTNTMDQDTVVAALESLAKVAEIKNVIITNSVFTAGPEEAATPGPDTSPKKDVRKEADESSDLDH